MLKKHIIILLTVFLCVSDLSAQQVNITKLDSLMNALEKNNKAMLSVCIAKNGKDLYSRSIGYSMITDSKKIPATSTTKYRIGSVSKMFTAVMIFQLIDEKKLSLTTKLSTYFPQIPHSDSITIANLLNHHSGIHDFTRDSEYLDWMVYPKTHQQMLDAINSKPPAFSPGEKGEYSNSNYVILGYIIEKITGNSYEKELKKRVTSRIGLLNTYYGGKTDPKHNEAYSYEIDSSKWVVSPSTDMSIPGGAGSIVSTPSDLNHFIDALFKHKLVSDSSLAQMTTIKDTYGMGIFKSPFYQRYSYGHNGRIDDFSTMVDYYPDDSMVMAMSCNGLDYRMNSIVIGMLKIYYHLPYEIPSFKTIVVSQEKLSSYEGIYSSKSIPVKITIKVADGILTAQATGQGAFPLDAESDSKFKFEDAGIQIEFHTSQDNKIDHLTIIQEGMPTVFEKE